MLTKCEESVSSDKVNRWVLKCIKRHGGPYEIPEQSKQTWTLMREFLEKNVFDDKISESKRKGCIVQGLLSCCLALEDSLRGKDEEIVKLQNALDKRNNTCEMLQKQSEIDNVNLKLHAVTIGEALIEKSKLCDQLSEENEEMKIRIIELEKNLQECRFASNLKFSNLQENTNLNSLSDEKSENSLPAAPTKTTTVYSNNNTGEVRLVMRSLKPKELDAILKDIGMVPRHDINTFLKWFCDLQHARDMYNLNPSDVERVLQNAIGNALYMRIKHICVQPLTSKDILKQLLCALYAVQSEVAIHGKIKQMQNESPYELSHRITTAMELLDCKSDTFEGGGLMHRVMVLDALDGHIREDILLTTPDPSNLNDILLRADNFWRKSSKGAVRVDVATLFRTDAEHRDQNTYGRFTRSNTCYHNLQNKTKQNNNQKSKTWIPFSQLKQEHDHLKIEYDKIKTERDMLQEENEKLYKELCRLKGAIDAHSAEGVDLLDLTELLSH